MAAEGHLGRGREPPQAERVPRLERVQAAAGVRAGLRGGAGGLRDRTRAFFLSVFGGGEPAFLLRC
jgi:hypothetical protein